MCVFFFLGSTCYFLLLLTQTKGDPNFGRSWVPCISKASQKRKKKKQKKIKKRGLIKQNLFYFIFISFVFVSHMEMWLMLRIVRP